MRSIADVQRANERFHDLDASPESEGMVTRAEGFGDAPRVTTRTSGGAVETARGGQVVVRAGGPVAGHGGGDERALDGLYEAADTRTLAEVNDANRRAWGQGDSDIQERVMRKQNNTSKVSQNAHPSVRGEFAEMIHGIRAGGAGRKESKAFHKGFLREGEVSPVKGSKKRANNVRGGDKDAPGGRVAADSRTLAEVNDANRRAWGGAAPPPPAAADAAPAEGVPHLGAWSMHAGGTAAAAGKHGYTHSVSHGESNPNLHTSYSISPVTNERGRHTGYHVGAWSPKAGHAHKSLGVARSPQEGVKLAREHFQKHFGGSKDASEASNAIVARAEKAVAEERAAKARHRGEVQGRVKARKESNRREGEAFIGSLSPRAQAYVRSRK